MKRWFARHLISRNEGQCFLRDEVSPVTAQATTSRELLGHGQGAATWGETSQLLVLRAQR